MSSDHQEVQSESHSKSDLSAIGQEETGTCFRCQASVVFIVDKVVKAQNIWTEVRKGRCPVCAEQGVYPYKKSVAKADIRKWEKEVVEVHKYNKSIEGTDQPLKEAPQEPPKSSRPGTRMSSIKQKRLSPAEEAQKKAIMAKKQADIELKKANKESKKRVKEAEKAKKEVEKQERQAKKLKSSE